MDALAFTAHNKASVDHELASIVFSGKYYMCL